MQKASGDKFCIQKSIIDIERKVTSTEELKKEYFELLSSNSIHYVEWMHKSSNPRIEFSEYPDSYISTGFYQLYSKIEEITTHFSIFVMRFKLHFTHNIPQLITHLRELVEV